MPVEVLKGKESLLPKDKKFKLISSNIKKITTQINNLASNATEKRVDTFNTSVNNFVSQWETLVDEDVTLQEEQVISSFAETLLADSSLNLKNRQQLSRLLDNYRNRILSAQKTIEDIEIVTAVKKLEIPDKIETKDQIIESSTTSQIEAETNEIKDAVHELQETNIEFINELRELYSLNELNELSEEEIKESIDELIAYAETVEDEEEFASIIYLIDEIEEYLAAKGGSEEPQGIIEEEGTSESETIETNEPNSPQEEDETSATNESVQGSTQNKSEVITQYENENDKQPSSFSAERKSTQPQPEVTQQTITKEWNKLYIDASQLNFSANPESQEANEKMVSALHPFLSTLHSYDKQSIVSRIDKFGYFINSYLGPKRLTEKGRTVIKNEIQRYYQILLKAPLTDHLFKVKSELSRLFRMIDIELPIEGDPFSREVRVLDQIRLEDIFTGESESFTGVDTYLESIYKIQVDNNRPSGHYEVLIGMDGREKRIDMAKKNEDKRKFYVADMIRAYFKEERMNAAKRVIALHETMPQGRSRFSREEIVEARNIISDVTEVAKLRGMQSELEMAARIYTNPSLKESFKTTLTTMVVPPHSSADSQYKEDIISMDVVNIDTLDKGTKKSLSDVYKLSSFIAMEKYKPLGYEFKGYAQDKTGLVASTEEVKQVMDTLFNLREQIELVAQELYIEIGNYSESLKEKNPQIIRSESAIKDWDITINPKLSSLFAKEEALQRKVAAVTKSFFDSTGAEIEFTGVQIKSSKHGMEKHARRHDNACIVYNKELTEMNFMDGAGGPYEEIINHANENLNIAFKKAFNKE